jgi:ribosomal protein L11 methyltransferase
MPGESRVKNCRRNRFLVPALQETGFRLRESHWRQNVERMPVFECKVEVNPRTVETIELALSAINEPRWIILEDRIAGRAWIAGHFQTRSGANESCLRLHTAIGPGSVTGKMRRRHLADADWAESYKAHFKAWRIRRRHWVPEWERATYRIRPGDQVVWLDPGMAFGTGNHQTTRLCCERLVEYAEACDHPGTLPRSRLSGTKHGDVHHNSGVIDAGCGSGILAISAARFGLGPVIGFYNDPIAVRVSRENAVLNKVASQVDFFDGELSTGLAGRRAGLVLANIQTDVLRRAAGELIHAVAPGGWLSLSGILASELDALRSEFLAAAALDDRTCQCSDGKLPSTPSTQGSQPKSNRQRVSRGWKTFSRRLGEWADLLMIRSRVRTSRAASD